MALTIPGAEVPSVRAQNLVLPSVQSSLPARIPLRCRPSHSCPLAGGGQRVRLVGKGLLRGRNAGRDGGCLFPQSIRSFFRCANSAAGVSVGRCAMLFGTTATVRVTPLRHKGVFSVMPVWPFVDRLFHVGRGATLCELSPSSPSDRLKSMNNTMIPLTVFPC